jgi:hypothetical protein
MVYKKAELTVCH